MKKAVFGLVLSGLIALIMFPGAASAAPPTIPMNGAWVRSALDDPTNPDLYFYFRVDVPSEVTVELRSYAYGPTIELYTDKFDYIDHYSTISNGTPDRPEIQGLTNYLNPGTYMIEIDRYVTTTGRVDLRVSAKPLNLSEKEPNDTKSKATALSNKKTIKAALAEPYDIDYYRFTLTAERYVDLEFLVDDNLIYYQVSDADGNRYLKGEHSTWSQDNYFKKTLLLSAGTYYVEVEYDYQSTLYELTYSTRVPPKAKKITLPKSTTLTKGFKYTLPVTYTPKDALLPTLKWSSREKSIASVTEKGVITAKKAGKTTITVKSGNLSAKSEIKVVDNVFKRSKPLTMKNKGIYTSTKMMYYKGDYLYVEIFVYNNTGRKIVEVDDMYLCFYDLLEDEDYPVYEKYIGRWKTGTIKNKSYKVYKAKLPKRQFNNLDLASGRYQAIISADFYVKGKGIDRMGNNWIPVLQ